MSDGAAYERDLAMLRAADPATVERVEAYLDEGGTERILARLRAGGDGTPAWPRARGPRRFVAIAGGVGALATLLAIALLPGTTDDEPAGPLAALAATAYAHELDGPYEYVDWRYDFESDRAIDRRIRTWAGANERFELRSFSVEGRPAGKDTGYINRSEGVSCDGSPERPDCAELPEVPTLTPASIWLEGPDLPQEPEELRTVLEQQTAEEYEAGIAVQPPTTGAADGVSGFGPAGPFDELDPRIRDEILAESLFSKLVAVVSNPYTAPELRGAAYELLSSVDGVELIDGRKDDRGRDASVIRFVPPDGLRRVPVASVRYDLYVDPATSEVLQLDVDTQGEQGDLVETVVSRRTAGSLPAEADAFREAAAEFVPPPPPITLPPPEPGPPVPLASGDGWEIAITDDRAIVLSDGTSSSSTSGYTLPPTLAEFDTYTPAKGSTKVMAGPVLDEADSMRIELTNGETLEAELLDAFDLRWAWAEIPRDERPASIDVLDANGEVLTSRIGRRVVDG